MSIAISYVRRCVTHKTLLDCSARVYAVKLSLEGVTQCVEVQSSILLIDHRQRRFTRTRRSSAGGVVLLCLIASIIAVGHFACDTSSSSSAPPQTAAASSATPRPQAAASQPVAQAQTAATQPTLESQLAATQAKLTADKSRLATLQASSADRVKDDPELVSAMVYEASAEKAVKEARANPNGSSVSATSSVWMSAKNDTTKIRDRLIADDPDVLQASRDVSTDVAEVARIQQAITQRDTALAQARQQQLLQQQQALQTQQAQQTAALASRPDLTNSQPSQPQAYSTPAPSGGYYGSGKTQHVNGYTRKDGTYVHSYNRRPGR